MVFCSQVLTELDKFPFFSSFTHYLFLVDSQTTAATDLSSEIQKFVEGHRWSFVFASIIIGVAVETRISYFSAFRIRHLFPDLKKDFLKTFFHLLIVKIFVSILLYLFLQFIFSLLSSIEDNVYVGLIIALVFGFIISSLNPNLEQIDQLMGGFGLSAITAVSSLINKILELYKEFQISIMETFDEKLASERNRLYDDTRHEFDRFQRLTIQKYIEELIGRYTLERTQKNYQRRLDAILGGFSGSDQKEELIWLLFTMGFTYKDINQIRSDPTQSRILKRLGEIEQGNSKIN